MNVYLNELTCPEPAELEPTSLLSFQRLQVDFADASGIGEVWCTSESFAKFLEDEKLWKENVTLRSLLLKRFRYSLIRDEDVDDELNAARDRFWNEEYRLTDEDGNPGGRCDTMGWAHVRGALTLGFAELPEWALARHPVSVSSVDGTPPRMLELYCLTDSRHLDIPEVARWCKGQKAPVPAETGLAPAEKTCVISEHHGTDATRPFAARLLECPYVRGVKSTDFSRNPSSPFVAKVDSTSGEIRVCLYWEAIPSQLIVFTTAQNAHQADFVAELLERQFDQGRRRREVTR